jgi:hypothetical protein
LWCHGEPLFSIFVDSTPKINTDNYLHEANITATQLVSTEEAFDRSQLLALDVVPQPPGEGLFPNKNHPSPAMQVATPANIQVLPDGNVPQLSQQLLLLLDNKLPKTGDKLAMPFVAPTESQTVAAPPIPSQATYIRHE